MMIYVAPFPWRADLHADDAVFICLGYGLKARVKIRRGFRSGKHPDGRGQQPVHGLAQVGQRDRIRDAESGHLREGVHARIGPAGAGHVHGMAFDLADYGLQHPWMVGKPGCTCQPWKSVPS